MIWDRALKETFVGSNLIETAVLDAIACFNIGADPSIMIMKGLDIVPGQQMEKACVKKDVRWLRIADYQESS